MFLCSKISESKHIKMILEQNSKFRIKHNKSKCVTTLTHVNTYENNEIKECEVALPHGDRELVLLGGNRRRRVCFSGSWQCKNVNPNFR